MTHFVADASHRSGQGTAASSVLAAPHLSGSRVSVDANDGGCPQFGHCFHGRAVLRREGVGPKRLQCRSTSDGKIYAARVGAARTNLRPTQGDSSLPVSLVHSVLKPTLEGGDQAFGGAGRWLCPLRIVVAGALLVSGSSFAAQLVGHPLLAFQQAQLQRMKAQPTGQEKQKFERKILRSGDRLVLEDKVNKISYQLDDQQLAGLFEGKDVKITVRLDSESNTIYISDIGLLNAKRSA